MYLHFVLVAVADVIIWILNRVTQFLVIVSGRLLMRPH